MRYALLDKDNMVRNLIEWDGKGSIAEFGDLTPVELPDDADAEVGDRVVDDGISTGVPLQVANQINLRRLARDAIPRLQEISQTKTSPEIAELAEVLVGLCSLVTNELYL